MKLIRNYNPFFVFIIDEIFNLNSFLNKNHLDRHLTFNLRNNEFKFAKCDLANIDVVL